MNFWGEVISVSLVLVFGIPLLALLVWLNDHKNDEPDQ